MGFSIVELTLFAMNAIPMVIPTARRPRFSGSGLFEFVVAMAIAGSALIVIVWGGIWPLAMWLGTLAFAAFLAHDDIRSAVGPLFVAFWLFYPEGVVGMDDLALKGVFASLIFAALAMLVPSSAERPRRGFTFDRVIIVCWVFWALLAYAPVLGGYLAERLHMFRGIILEDVPHSTSGLKTAVPLIGAVFAVKVGLIAGASPREARAVRRAAVLSVMQAVLVSLVLFAIGVDLLPFELSAVTPGTRLHGFAIPDANGFARALLMPMLLATGWMLFGPPGLWKKFLIGPMLGIVAILLTQSRTTYVSMTVGFAVLGLLAVNRLRFWLLAALGTVSLTIAFFAARLNEVFSAGGERMSAQNLLSRIDLWKGVISILKSNPWFGAHPTGYGDQLVNMGIEQGAHQSAHNFYLWLGAEWGIPMIALALAVLVATVWHGWRAWKLGAGNIAGEDVRSVGAFVMACSVAFFIHGLTEVVSPAIVFFNLGLGMAVHRRAVRATRLRDLARSRGIERNAGQRICPVPAPVVIQSERLTRAAQRADGGTL